MPLRHATGLDIAVAMLLIGLCLGCNTSRARSEAPSATSIQKTTPVLAGTSATTPVEISTPRTTLAPTVPLPPPGSALGSTPDQVPATAGPKIEPTITSVASTDPAPAAPGSTSSTSSESPPDAEGWKILASTGAGHVIWGRTQRPSIAHPEVVASYAVFDPTGFHAALFNGTQLPGGGPWVNGSRVSGAAEPALVAAFNGGFKFKHIRGGYFAEGREIKPLLDGEATLAIRADGWMTIGVYGKDLTNDGSWTSLRQNLPLIVDGGHEVVSVASEPGVAHIYWGDDFGGVVRDLRSALCLRRDGRLMYAVVGPVDIDGLATALVTAGCERAMELDINGSWPQFVTIDRSGPTPAGVGLDPRMTHLDRYLTGSSKDFIALFDPALLPETALP